MQQQSVMICNELQQQSVVICGELQQQSVIICGELQQQTVVICGELQQQTVVICTADSNQPAKNVHHNTTTHVEHNTTITEAVMCTANSDQPSHTALSDLQQQLRWWCSSDPGFATGMRARGHVLVCPPKIKLANQMYDSDVL